MQDTQAGTIDPDDPLLIAQTLTYVTDNGSVLMSYSSAPFSGCKFTSSIDIVALVYVLQSHLRSRCVNNQ